VNVGVNQGEKVPVELADLFEGRSVVRPEAIDLSAWREAWILVIGGGGEAPLQPSWQQNRERKRSSRQSSGLEIRTPSWLKGDSGRGRKETRVLHYLDTMGGGGFKIFPIWSMPWLRCAHDSRMARPARGDVDRKRREGFWLFCRRAVPTQSPFAADYRAWRSCGS